jgi:hypothetical protein
LKTAGRVVAVGVTDVVEVSVVVGSMVEEVADEEVVVRTGGTVVVGVGALGLRAIHVPRAIRRMAPPPRSQRLRSRGRGVSSGLGDSGTAGLY